MKVCLMELIKELENDDNDTAEPMASVNVTTVRIEKILEETPATMRVEMELMKSFQELASKKLWFF